MLLPGATTPIVTPQWGIFRSAGPAGLLHTTARDLLTFVSVHLAGGVTADGTRLLSEQSAAAMLLEQVAIPDPFTFGSHWGLGWILMTWDDQRPFGHDGATLGQGAFLRVLPDAGLSVALLTNGGAHVRDLFEDLYSEVFVELAGVTMPRRPEPTVDAAVLDPSRFFGTYAREGIEVKVRPRKNGGLEVATRNTGPLSEGMPDAPPLELQPYRGDILLARQPGDETWYAAVFFDLDGRRYVHFGGRATPRVSTEA